MDTFNRESNENIQQLMRVSSLPLVDDSMLRTAESEPASIFPPAENRENASRDTLCAVFHLSRGEYAGIRKLKPPQDPLSLVCTTLERGRVFNFFSGS